MSIGQNIEAQVRFLSARVAALEKQVAGLATARKRLLRPDEVQALTGLSARTVYRYCELGFFERVQSRAGGAVRVTLESVERYLSGDPEHS